MTEKGKIMKIPEICGYSVWLYGVPICRLECCPCSEVGECALFKAERFAESVVAERKDDER